jgi:hypothetical protein
MPNKQYHAPETTVTFKESGGDVVITLLNLGYGAGRISARVDRGSGSKPGLYRWRAVMQWENNPAATDYAEIVLSTSDGTDADGNVGTGDAALTSAQKSNCDVIGSVKAEEATGSTARKSSGTFTILDRYYSIGVWNASATKNLKNSANVSYVILTPVPPEQQ